MTKPKPKASPQYPRAIFAIRMDSALRVKPFISNEATRYYLNGVHVEPHKEGVLCVATDGHTMGIRLDRGGFCASPAIFRLPPEIKMPRKSLFVRTPWLVGIETAPAKGHLSVVEVAAKKDEDTAANAIARVEECVLRIGNALIDGTYPDWSHVVPKAGEGDVIRGFNGEYLRLFGKQMTLRGADEASPHMVQVHGDPDFVGIIMPMRAERGPLPEWMPHPAMKA